MSSPIGERRDLAYRALAEPTRRHLLRVLDEAGEPQDVRTLAGRIGVHENTARKHLEMLRRAGLVTRHPEARPRRGRPRMLYEATPSRSPDFEGYRFLTEILAGYMETALDDPAAAAEEAGRVWGRFLVERPLPFARLGMAETIERIVTALMRLGFDPDAREGDSRVVIELHDCPFRDLARTRGTVICSVHRGILRGMAEELGGTVEVADFRPFVEPSLCVADICRVDPDAR